jgi:hypothetical protein
MVRTSAIACSGSIPGHCRPHLRHQRARIDTRLHDQPHPRVGLLQDRIIQALLRHRLAEVDAVDRADDADDGVGGAGGTATADLLPERAPVGEVALHQILIDDDGVRLVAVSASVNSRPATSGICIARK